MIRILLFATPESARPLCETLHSADDVAIAAVVTQPPRPKGRGHRVQQNGVQAWAEQHHIPVEAPATLRDPAVTQTLAAYTPDLCVLYAYGNLLPSHVLNIAPHGVVNIHPSLLPKYRGASPIQTALLNGDAETGISLMLLDAGMDTGPLLAQFSEPILANDTQTTLRERLLKKAAEHILPVLRSYLSGQLQLTPQPTDGVTETRQLTRDDGMLDFSKRATDLERQVRAYESWPGSFTQWKKQRLHIHAARVIRNPHTASEPGVVFVSHDGFPAVVTGDGALQCDMVQIAGKNRTDGISFLNGYPAFIGSRLPS